MLPRAWFAVALSVLCCLTHVFEARSDVVHTTNGQFDSGEWDSVAPTFFPVVGNSGGAYLYADQGTGAQTGNLYLMYDYVNSPVLGFDPKLASGFGNIFFSVINSDYVVHVPPTPNSQSPTGFDVDPFT